MGDNILQKLEFLSVLQVYPRDGNLRAILKGVRCLNIFKYL